MFLVVLDKDWEVSLVNLSLYLGFLFGFLCDLGGWVKMLYLFLPLFGAEVSSSRRTLFTIIPAGSAIVGSLSEMSSKLSNKCNIIYFPEISEICEDNTPIDYHRIDSIEIPKDEMRILIFTSGTTGNSKGVCLSQKNISTICSQF